MPFGRRDRPRSRSDAGPSADLQEQEAIFFVHGRGGRLCGPAQFAEARLDFRNLFFFQKNITDRIRNLGGTHDAVKRPPQIEKKRLAVAVDADRRRTCRRRIDRLHRRVLGKPSMENSAFAQQLHSIEQLTRRLPSLFHGDTYRK